jgi:hypothetical protein
MLSYLAESDRTLIRRNITDGEQTIQDLQSLSAITMAIGRSQKF